MPAVVRVDHKRLRQILINLLANAVKFTDAGAVTLRLRYVHEIAYLDVEDTGIGISDTDSERIFLPFERSASADLRQETGTGLGLTISSMLAHIMGGELTVKSQIAKGSLFQLKLYLPEVVAPRPKLQLRGPLSGYVGRRQRILVVDDQASQRRILADMLSPIGFDIAEANSGPACLAAIATQRPDLVLLDIAMPAMDGWAVSRAIRDQGEATLPILIVSANAFDMAAGPAGFPCHDGFIVKPVSLLELLAKIKHHLQLEWITEPAPVAPDTAGASAIPAVADLTTLLELGAIGYVKGILYKLSELEQCQPECLEFIAELRQLVRQFHLNAYANRLKETLQHAAANVR